MILIGQNKIFYSVDFGCIDPIHHMHDRYKSSLAYIKCRHEQDPKITFFRDLMKKKFNNVILAILGLARLRALEINL